MREKGNEEESKEMRGEEKENEQDGKDMMSKVDSRIGMLACRRPMSTSAVL